ncbi:hypothetical protein MKW98_016730, partial [Papaver atlanticum]
KTLTVYSRNLWIHKRGTSAALALEDTSPTSASQAFVSTDGVFNARARVLGGGTCINDGFYTRASSSELVEESYPWVEKKILHWPKLAPWQQAVRDGLIDIGMTPYNGYSYEHIQGTKVVGTIFDTKGHCSTAAELLATRNPKNLQVLIYATVQKIMFDKTGKQPKAVGLLFNDEKGKVETEFEDLSEDGKIQGWESKGGNISSQDSIIDLDYYITVHALMDVVHIKRDESENFLARIDRHENSLDTENFDNPGA